MFGHLLYVLTFLNIALAIPARHVAENGGLVVALGALGLWRYSWGLVNFLRAQLFIRVYHPRRRAVATGRYLDREPAHAFFLVTTYKIPPAVTQRVYQSVFHAAAAARGGATIVASVVEAADERLIRQLYSVTPIGGSRLRLIIDRIPATGKRDALAASLRIISRNCPGRDDLVVFVDGDSCPPHDIVESTAPFFTDQNIGALTTDEDCDIPQAGLFHDWFKLRFAQRQMMMSSMGLSKRVLTLTGRLSVFRATLACDAGFIRAVQYDSIDHWRLGKVDFLTGDDKSTWFWLLKHGYEMAYLPDVRSISMETQPEPSFLRTVIALMVRWFGNMLRTNARALALGPGRIGLFTWWSLFDQRISMWTTLLGPTTAIVSSFMISPVILPLYIAWVMFTRYIHCWILRSFGSSFPISYPFLLYFSQITGALVKTYVLFRLDRQRWTRQSSTTAWNASRTSARWLALCSSYVHLLAFGWLLLAAFMISGATI
jgi:mannuronan synthase